MIIELQGYNPFFFHYLVCAMASFGHLESTRDAEHRRLTLTMSSSYGLLLGTLQHDTTQHRPTNCCVVRTAMRFLFCSELLSEIVT